MKMCVNTVDYSKNAYLYIFRTSLALFRYETRFGALRALRAPKAPRVFLYGSVAFGAFFY